MKCLTSGENQTQHLNTNTSNQLIQACFEATGHYHLTVKCEAICLTANESDGASENKYDALFVYFNESTSELLGYQLAVHDPLRQVRPQITDCVHDLWTY